MAIGVEAANVLRSVQRDEAELRSLRMVRRKQRLLANPGHVYSLLREERALPLCFAKVDGHFVAEAAAVDREARRVWGQVYAGNLARPAAALAAFIARYGGLTLQGPVLRLPPLTVADLRARIKAASPTTAPFGGWRPREFKYLSDQAVGCLVDLLSAIEGGAPWPRAILYGKVAFLSKVLEPEGDVLSYRLLTILPYLYRCWMGLRIHQVVRVQAWEGIEFLHAAFRGRNATTAWWSTAAWAEEARLLDIPCVTSGLDIYKCFDQLPRTFIYAALAAAGVPNTVLGPYLRFMEGLQLVNSLGTGLGEPYTRPTAIPQGCPASMLAMAVLSVPWGRVATLLGAVPRGLADDFIISAEGPLAQATIEAATDGVHSAMAASGSRLAPDKNWLMATDPAVRRSLRRRVWTGTGTTIRVALSHRDLGGHLNSGQRMVGTTLTDRLKRVIPLLPIIRRPPGPFKLKVAAITGKVLPSGLHAAAAVPVPVKYLRQLTSGIVDILGCDHGGNRSVDLMLALACDLNVDPWHTSSTNASGTSGTWQLPQARYARGSNAPSASLLLPFVRATTRMSTRACWGRSLRRCAGRRASRMAPWACW